LLAHLLWPSFPPHRPRFMSRARTGLCLDVHLRMVGVTSCREVNIFYHFSPAPPPHRPRPLLPSALFRFSICSFFTRFSFGVSFSSSSFGYRELSFRFFNTCPRFRRTRLSAGDVQNSQTRFFSGAYPRLHFRRLQSNFFSFILFEFEGSLTKIFGDETQLPPEWSGPHRSLFTNVAHPHPFFPPQPNPPAQKEIFERPGPARSCLLREIISSATRPTIPSVVSPKKPFGLHQEMKRT